MPWVASWRSGWCAGLGQQVVYRAAPSRLTPSQQLSQHKIEHGLWLTASTQGTRMFKFEWDNQKAQSNLLKHGVSFDEAVSVFGDALALTFSDTDHSMDEDRSRTYGISNKERHLVVVHTERRNSIRIISARKATRYEKDTYKNG
jgi:uncharacterized DUF497 family protein